MKSPNISEEYVLNKRKELGQCIKSLRESQGLTMEELGDRLGIGKATVSKIEAGKWNFGIDTLIIFAEALGFDIKLL